MVKKRNKRFLMRLMPGDAKLLRDARKKSGMISNSAAVRMALRSLARGGKK